MCFGDADNHELAEKRVELALEECEPVAARAAADLACIFRIPRLDEHLLQRAEQPRTALGSVLAHFGVDCGEPRLFDVLGKLRIPCRGGCVWSRRVGRRVDEIKAHRVHQLECALELRVRLTRKAHDCIRADSGVGHCIADGRDDTQKARGSVAAAHAAQHVVVSGLERHVKMLAHFRQPRACRDEPCAHIAWMAGHKADALDASHFVHVLQQLAECLPRCEVAPVRVDVLAEKNDFAYALCGKLLDFSADRRHRARLLEAARRRNHAIRAALIAAVDHVDPRSDCRRASRQRKVFANMRGRRRAQLRAGRERVRHELAHAICVLRAEHDVELGNASEQRFAFLLRDAACHEQLHACVAPFARGVNSEHAVQLGLGVFSDRARVEHHHLRRQLVRRGVKACAFELTGHPFRVGLVCLAAHRRDKVSLLLQLRELVGMGRRGWLREAELRDLANEAALCGFAHALHLERVHSVIDQKNVPPAGARGHFRQRLRPHTERGVDQRSIEIRTDVAHFCLSDFSFEHVVIVRTFSFVQVLRPRVANPSHRAGVAVQLAHRKCKLLECVFASCDGGYDVVCKLFSLDAHVREPHRKDVLRRKLVEARRRRLARHKRLILQNLAVHPRFAHHRDKPSRRARPRSHGFGFASNTDSGQLQTRSFASHSQSSCAERRAIVS
mmetsp:Transcript_5611/g.15035  ORF Transcript_5611/g.15035 Transcript_5611/m.15035 type:complete len:672 (-) Transcript_5611:86-2101(-)